MRMQLQGRRPQHRGHLLQLLLKSLFPDHLCSPSRKHLATLLPNESGVCEGVGDDGANYLDSVP